MTIYRKLVNAGLYDPPEEYDKLLELSTEEVKQLHRGILIVKELDGELVQIRLINGNYEILFDDHEMTEKL